MTDSRTVAAVRDNAEWCDLVCRTHGIATACHADAWVAATRSPPAYPDAVTLRASASADGLLARIDRSPGCSVKDSFASLDLSGSGFEVLFHVEWIHRAPSTLAATGGGSVFRPALLDEPAVALLMATDAGGGLAAGAIGHRGGSVVGLSNLFTVSADPDEAWAGAVVALSAAFPDLPLVGYERGDDLAAARRAGFTTVGRLRVWRRA